MLHTEAANLECWSLLQLSGAELALREATYDAEHAEGWPPQVGLHGSKLPAESWSKLQHSKFVVSPCNAAGDISKSSGRKA
jgi:hypothetical protein